MQKCAVVCWPGAHQQADVHDFGIGNDLIDIRRIEKTLERFGDRFVQRIFTSDERARSERRRLRGVICQAVCRQGSVLKALGTGLRQGVFWRDMGVSNLPSGKPTMRLTNGALHRLEKITPDGMRAQIDLTITDDFPLAQAIVIISAVPADSEIVS